MGITFDRESKFPLFILKFQRLNVVYFVLNGCGVGTTKTLKSVEMGETRKISILDLVTH